MVHISVHDIWFLLDTVTCNVAFPSAWSWGNYFLQQVFLKRTPGRAWFNLQGIADHRPSSGILLLFCSGMVLWTWGIQFHSIEVWRWQTVLFFHPHHFQSRLSEIRLAYCDCAIRQCFYTPSEVQFFPSQAFKIIFLSVVLRSLPPLLSSIRRRETLLS